LIWIETMTKRFMSTTLSLPAMSILTALLPALAGCSGKAEQPANPPVAVLVGKVTLSDYSPAGRITGEIRPRVQSDLSFQVAGRISERTVNVGDHVAAGQVLARLDPAEKEADVRSAEASLSASEAVLRQAESNFQRQQALLDKRIATRRDYDKAEETLRTAQASLEVAKTQLETAREQLSYTELKAEKPGVVTALNVEVGQVVQAAEAVYSVAEDGPRDAVFDLNEAVLLTDDVAPEITLILISDPTVKAKGKVRQISPTVDQSTGAVRVKVEVKDPPPAMALGAAVIGEASLRSEKRLIIPSAALVFSGNGRPGVWLVDDEDRHVTLETIRISAYEGDRVIVASGLSEGQTIVTRGAQLLHSDQIVSASEEASQ
jgi:RND family efflux transporter MFP subunit